MSYKYTMNSSISEILSDPEIRNYLPGVFSPFLLDSVPKKMLDTSLTEVSEKVMTAWGFPFPGEGFLHSALLAKKLADRSRYHYIPLWNRQTDDYEPKFKNDRDSVTLLDIRTKDQKVRPAAVICPGGGYEFLMSDNEGISYGEMLDQMGYHSFVLTYRVAPYRYPIPQTDLALAMKYIRANSKELNIDPDRILIIGSSAGGHLCASFAAEPEKYERILQEELKTGFPLLAEAYAGISVRPDMVCLCYPVISFVSEQHEESFQNLSGGDESLRKPLSVELVADSRYPRTFIWACKDDAVVPVSNSIRMKEALDSSGADAMLAVYPTGGHGCGTAEGTSAEGWAKEMAEYFR